MRLSVSVSGIVQGVGFRPFVWREATARGLSGWVRNVRGAVEIEVQGPPEQLLELLGAIERIPSPARVDRLSSREIEERPESDFSILDSGPGAEVAPTLPADLATCDECLAEIRDPAERRHAYPFTNCTRCGPRYSIVESLPYDRERTSMRHFPLCDECAGEYADPRDRRFHAEPIACPVCGPSLALLDPDARTLARGSAALAQAAECVRSGNVLALRGIGGFQLLADATSERAVERLRARKQREAKPLAVMFPSLEALHRCTEATADEVRALSSPEAPIVLVRRRPGCLAGAVAPNNPRVGALLPYTPLHHLLLDAIGAPAVCTSGNLSEEPMCIDVDEAVSKLGPIADALLVHDRPIVRPVDDSVARVGPAGLELLRRARGFAPLPVATLDDRRTLLALGAHLKSTIALSRSGQLIMSQHIGDLEHAAARELLERNTRDLLSFFDIQPELIACDRHPDYASTALAERLAARFDVPLVRVQHHHAHVAAVMAEHGLDGPVLGLAWDGTGLGSDGASWGGEALVVDRSGFRRVAHLRPFRLPGGDRAAREPWRAAVGALFELSPDRARTVCDRHCTKHEVAVLLRALERGFAAPWSTSVGRLFDAVAAVTGAPDRCSFEAQAAVELELVAGELAAEPYPLPLSDADPAVADWGPLLLALDHDVERGVPRSVIAARFHEGLVALGVRIAQRVALQDVVLAGGCMQNLRLARGLHRRLRDAGFRVHGAGCIPANDGGISAGQVLVAAWTTST